MLLLLSTGAAATLNRPEDVTGAGEPRGGRVGRQLRHLAHVPHVFDSAWAGTVLLPGLLAA
jgi:hypothetical protein